MTRDGKYAGGREMPTHEERDEERIEKGKHAKWCFYPKEPCCCGVDKE